MTRLEIINLWKSIGWYSAKDYHNSCIYNPPIIENLDPNKVSPVEFWSAAEKQFYTDPISNSNFCKVPFSIKRTNSANHNIAKYLGMIGQLEMAISNVTYKLGKVAIAEIGCGYGAFWENYIKLNHIQYTGFDLIPRFEAAVKIKGKDGTFSTSQVKAYKEQYNIFYSANVFQHLTPRQIQKYLTQIYEMLPYGGYASVMYVHNVDATYHYGQKIDIIDELSFIKLIETIGYQIVSSAKSYTGELKPFSLLLEK